MDETRVRAIIREEIALAMKTLGEIADLRNSRDDSPGTDALYEISGAAFDFQQYAYAYACETADAERAEDAANPFEETKPGEAVDAAVKAFVHDEVQNVLREIRDTFHMSGLAEDYRIGERLDYVISARERTVNE